MSIIRSLSCWVFFTVGGGGHGLSEDAKKRSLVKGLRAGMRGTLTL